MNKSPKRPLMPANQREMGFTIMEVMVAIMILAVSVVSIFGAQFAAVATTEFAKHSTQAIQLAKCRMSEIELEVQVENGFEEADVETTGDCCELLEGESELDEFTCSWEIKTIELPDLSTMMTGGGPDGGGGFLGDFGMDDTGDGFGAMGMASAFAPMLSDMLRQAIRRVTVTVEWNQGSKKKEFVLSQYLTHPTQGPLEMMHNAANAADMAEEEGLLPGMTPGERPNPGGGGFSGAGPGRTNPK